ncbi:MAG: BT4734/BF3469 family protein [Prevotellaceae bacterium]|nr:BT4734/BF3469 family protein [Prevotellaceae bacterium]
MEINLFEGYTSVVPVSATIETVVETIRTDDRLKCLTESFRSSSDKSVKASTPVFAVACLFSGGKQQKNVTSLTGMSMVDCDHVTEGLLQEIVTKARDDPHTLMVYRTISGNGCRIIFRYERDVGKELKMQIKFYEQAFAAGNDYYQRILSFQPDLQCKNVTRLSGMAYDPDVYYNPNAEEFPLSWIERQSRKIVERKKKAKMIEGIQTMFDTVLAAELKEEGAVYEPGRHNDYIMRLGYKLNQFGIRFKDALEWTADHFPDYTDTEQTFRSCYRNTEEFGIRSPTRKKGYRHSRKDSDGKADYAGVGEIEAFLAERVELRYNMINARLEYRLIENPDEPATVAEGKGDFMRITDRIANTLWMEMARTRRVTYQDMVRVMDSSFVKPYHPFRFYLDSLPDWKKGDRDYLHELSDSVKVKGGKRMQSLFHKYLTKWLVGMLAAWIDDNVVNNVILVLIGEQGAYKTTWFNNLLPPELRQYFYTKTNAYRMGRDDLLTLANYGLVCCEELDTMRPAELNQLKAAVTMRSIDERAAYARYHEHRPHIASFCGTGNNVQFLSDPTGNRRWLPFEVDRIKSPHEYRIDYTGLYSQAYSLLRTGFRYWFTMDDIARLAKHNRNFETPRLEHELVMLNFRKPTATEHGQYMPSAAILQYISANISQKLSAVWVGRAMNELGFESIMTHGVRGYLVIPRTNEEIREYQKRLALGETDDDSDVSDDSDTGDDPQDNQQNLPFEDNDGDDSDPVGGVKE